MKYSVFIVLGFFVVRCAGPQRFDTDKEDASYHSGHRVAPAATNSKSAQEGNVFDGQPLAGGLAAGIMLAANRNYYRKSAITGRLSCSPSSAGNIEVPCDNVEVIIVDAKNKELSRTQTREGEFAFRVNEGVPYRLKVSSKQYQMNPKTTGSLYLGDDVILKLVSKSIASQSK